MSPEVATIFTAGLVTSAGLVTAIIKIFGRKAAPDPTLTASIKELVELTRRSVDLQQEMRGDHRVHQLTLEQAMRDIERVGRTA